MKSIMSRHSHPELVQANDGESQAEQCANCTLPPAAACPDCPAVRLGVLKDVVGSGVLHTLLAHETAPLSWGRENQFGLVRRGVLIRERIDAHGHATAIDAAGPACLVSFGLGIQPTHRGSSAFFAATDVMIVLFPNDAAEVIREGPLARDLLKLVATSLERVERIAEARGHGSADQKVASLLCALADTLSPPRKRDRMPADLQQRDFARLLGMRPETVSRSLSTLEKRGIIERGPDGLVLKDRTSLEQVE